MFQVDINLHMQGAGLPMVLLMVLWLSGGSTGKEWLTQLKTAVTLGRKAWKTFQHALGQIVSKDH